MVGNGGDRGRCRSHDSGGGIQGDYVVVHREENEMSKNYPTRMHEVLDIPESEVIYGFKDVEGNHWFDFFLQTDGLPYEDNLRVLSTSKLTSLINHPERIIRRPRLTEEQVRQMQALVTLGFRWLIKNNDCSAYAYSYMPERMDEWWNGLNAEVQLFIDMPTGVLYNLVSWSDPEPLDIVATLKANGVEVEG
jgi:hypothetical protein